MEKLLILVFIYSLNISCQKKKNESGNKSNYYQTPTLELPTPSPNKDEEKTSTALPPHTEEIKKDPIIYNFKINDVLKIKINGTETPIKIRLQDDEAWASEVNRKFDEDTILLNDFGHLYYIDLPRTKTTQIIEFTKTSTTEPTLISITDGINIQEEFIYNELSIKKSFVSDAKKLFININIPNFNEETQFHFILKDESDTLEVITEKTTSLNKILTFLKKDYVKNEFEISKDFKRFFSKREIHPKKLVWQLINKNDADLTNTTGIEGTVYLAKLSREELAKKISTQNSIILTKANPNFKREFKNISHFKIDLTGIIEGFDTGINIEKTTGNHVFDNHHSFIKNKTPETINPIHFDLFINNIPKSFEEINNMNLQTSETYNLEIRPKKNFCYILLEGLMKTVGYTTLDWSNNATKVEKCDTYKINLQLDYLEFN